MPAAVTVTNVPVSKPGAASAAKLLGGVAPRPAPTTRAPPTVMRTTQSPARFITSCGLALLGWGGARRTVAPNVPPAGRVTANTPSEFSMQPYLSQLYWLIVSQTITTSPAPSMASGAVYGTPSPGAIAAGAVNVPPGVPKAAWVPAFEDHTTTVSPLSAAASCTPPNGRTRSAADAGDAHRASPRAGARHATRTARSRLMTYGTARTSEHTVHWTNVRVSAARAATSSSRCSIANIAAPARVRRSILS